MARSWLRSLADERTAARNRQLIEAADVEIIERDGKTFMLRRLASVEPTGSSPCEARLASARPRATRYLA